MVKSIKRESSLEISIKCRTGVDDKDNYDFLKQRQQEYASKIGVDYILYEYNDEYNDE